jgi:protein-disulfide isomerase
MSDQKTNLYIPGAIILAGFLIATGIYLTKRDDSPVISEQPVKKSINVDPITKDDHLLGDPNSNITIVEYSDTECPFCKRFDTTMNSIIDTYGKDSKVAWVYRHFPLDSLHSKARKEAEATECANELGGNSAFWSYLGLIYKNTPTNNGLDPAQLPIFAKTARLDVAKFNTCLASGKYASSVQADLQSGIKIGIQGTPYSVMILKKPITDDQNTAIVNFTVQNQLSAYVKVSDNRKEISLNGALPLEAIKKIIDTVL